MMMTRRLSLFAVGLLALTVFAVVPSADAAPSPVECSLITDPGTGVECHRTGGPCLEAMWGIHYSNLVVGGRNSCQAMVWWSGE